MALIRRALIPAAGQGSRLSPNGLGPPKPLIPVAGVPLLSRSLALVEAAGVEEAVVVLGYRGEEIEQYYRKRTPRGLRVRWLPGADPGRSNGVSVLHARSVLHEPFLLLMSDHLVDASVVQRMAGIELDPSSAVLAVDFNRTRIFDLEEATKVKLDGDRITAIGKGLSDYDAVDTGFFACTPTLFEALASSLRQGDCSLSDGVQEMARRGLMRAIDIGEAEWIDIDTPEALRHVESLIRAGKLSFQTSESSHAG